MQNRGSVGRAHWFQRIGLAAAIVLLAAGSVHATVHTATGNIKTSLLDKVKYVQRNLGGPDRYPPPTAQELDIWRLVMFNMYTGNLAVAADLAGGISPKYRVVHFTDTSGASRSYHVLLEADISGGVITPVVEKGWGVYVFDPAPVRELALQVPHPLADDNTEDEGIEGLLAVRPRVLSLFTSHRCASLVKSVQPTSAIQCDSNPGYHMSDGSHAASSANPPITNPFQVAHEELLKLYPSTTGIQFHGNAQTSTCPKIFLSNTGDDGHVIPNGAVRQLEASLAARFPGQVRVYDGSDTCQLPGTENLQGRFSNGSMNPVLDSPPAPQALERFIHIEQLRTGVRDTEANRLQVIEGIADAFKPIRRSGQITSQ